MMKGELMIREYEKADLPDLRSLILEAENFGEPFMESEMMNIKRDGISDFGHVYVAAFGSEVVGYVTLRKNIFAVAIDSIIVKREHQRKGIGRELVEKAKAYARSEGFRILRSDTASFMEYAIKFYLACGFVPCGYVHHDFGLNTTQVHFYMDLSDKCKGIMSARSGV